MTVMGAAPPSPVQTSIATVTFVISQRSSGFWSSLNADTLPGPRRRHRKPVAGQPASDARHWGRTAVTQ
jgi:hypothetical protein